LNGILLLVYHCSLRLGLWLFFLSGSFGCRVDSILDLFSWYSSLSRHCSRLAKTPEPILNDGQKALADLRRGRAEQRDTELRRVRAMISEDKQVQDAPAAIPERVAQRMGARMLPFVGLPLFLGMGSFVTFWYYATYKDVGFEPSIVAGSTILILVFGLLVRSIFFDLA
jgi:hypothetical protein